MTFSRRRRSSSRAAGGPLLLAGGLGSGGGQGCWPAAHPWAIAVPSGATSVAHQRVLGCLEGGLDQGPGFLSVQQAPAGGLGGGGAPAQQGPGRDQEVDQGRQRPADHTGAGRAGSGIGKRGPPGRRSDRRWRGGPGWRGGLWLDAVEGVAALGEVGEGQGAELAEGAVDSPASRSLRATASMWALEAITSAVSSSRPDRQALPDCLTPRLDPLVQPGQLLAGRDRLRGQLQL